MLHRPAALSLLVAALAAAPAALAAESPGLAAPASPAAPPPAQTGPDAVEDPAAGWGGARRPWLYTADPTGPAPGRVLASLGVGYAQVDRGAARPFAADVAHAGAVFDASAEVGLARFASLYAQGLLASQGASEPVRAGVFAGVNFFPLPAQWPVDLAISGGYLRELGGTNGVWGRVGVAGDLGRFRLSLTTLGEKVFDPDRDEVDLLVTTGVSVAVLPVLRLGAEYVVQDLEGAWEPEEADGGIRHFVGAVAALELAQRVQISAGPAIGLSQGSPELLGRLTAMYAF